MSTTECLVDERTVKEALSQKLHIIIRCRLSDCALKTELWQEAPEIADLNVAAFWLKKFHDKVRKPQPFVNLILYRSRRLLIGLSGCVLRYLIFKLDIGHRFIVEIWTQKCT